MSLSVIECLNLSKSYALYDRKIDRLKEALHPKRKKYGRDFHALKDVSFSVQKGESVGLAGENGSGKSTLLKLIAGVLTPSSGTVRVQGRVAALLELGTGFNPELTGLENLFFAGTLMGLTREQLHARKDNILGFADIGEFVHQPVKTYSSGMQMRLAFAVQTAMEPDVLIVDEALSVGDIFFQAKCMRRIRTMLDSGVTVFFVTHNMSALKELCRRALLLHHGELVEDSDSAAVVQRYLRLAGQKTPLPSEAETQRLEKECAAASPNATERSAQSLEELMAGQETFLKSAGHDRVQNGQAEFLNVSLLDAEGKRADVFDFGQRVRCRMVIKVNQPVSTLWVGYKIRTVTGVDIIHADSSLCDLLRYAFEQRKTYVAEWDFRMNLCHGSYVLGCALGIPVPPTGAHRQMHHVDLIHAAQTFTVLPRSAGMVGSTAVWDNELNFKEVSAE